MEESTAEQVVELLRIRRIFASINRRVGVYNVGVRVVIPDGREAIWDNDGAAGLEAMVLRDGMLVGFVPQLPDSDDLDATTIARIIADTDYDAPISTAKRQTITPTTSSSAAPATPPRGAPPRPTPATPARSWRDKLRRR